MKYRLSMTVGLALMLGAFAFWMWGCSTTSQSNPLSTLIRNLTAAQCDNQPATLANIPTGLLTQAQAAQLLSLACAGIFGTAPAPASAPGMGPMIPGPSAAPTPAARI